MAFGDGDGARSILNSPRAASPGARRGAGAGLIGKRPCQGGSIRSALGRPACGLGEHSRGRLPTKPPGPEPPAGEPSCPEANPDRVWHVIGRRIAFVPGLVGDVEQPMRGGTVDRRRARRTSPPEPARQRCVDHVHGAGAVRAGSLMGDRSHHVVPAVLGRKEDAPKQRQPIPKAMNTHAATRASRAATVSAVKRATWPCPAAACPPGGSCMVRPSGRPKLNSTQASLRTKGNYRATRSDSLRFALSSTLHSYPPDGLRLPRS
jgi:hypothetical protein